MAPDEEFRSSEVQEFKNSKIQKFRSNQSIPSTRGRSDCKTPAATHDLCNSQSAPE